MSDKKKLIIPILDEFISKAVIQVKSRLNKKKKPVSTPAISQTKTSSIKKLHLNHNAETIGCACGTTIASSKNEGIILPSKKKQAVLRKGPTWDSHTNRRISLLDKRVQQPALNLINRVEYEIGLRLRVAQGLRTIKEQDDIYAQGRTKPGNIVSNAKGGQSYHNFGLAIDVVIINSDGKAIWTRVSDDIVKIAEQEGFEWGGNWKSIKDYPHFQMTFGQTLEQLRILNGIKI